MKELLLPPIIQIVLLFLALAFWRRYRIVSYSFIIVAGSTLYLLSIQPVSDRMISKLEAQTSVLNATTMMFHHQLMAEAIVVLGGGAYAYAPDYDMKPQPSSRLLQRLRYAAHIAKQTELPILVSGGTIEGVNEAMVMDRVLWEDFGVKTRWQEGDSRTTMENGQCSRKILKSLGISRIILVTSASHMLRARLVFQHEGFDVITAPTAYLGRLKRRGWHDWLPSKDNLEKSYEGMYEVMGMLWYRIRYSV